MRANKLLPRDVFPCNIFASVINAERFKTISRAHGIYTHKIHTNNSSLLEVWLQRQLAWWGPAVCRRVCNEERKSSLERWRATWDTSYRTYRHSSYSCVVIRLLCNPTVIRYFRAYLHRLREWKRYIKGGGQGNANYERSRCETMKKAPSSTRRDTNNVEVSKLHIGLGGALASRSVNYV